jgi:DNA repair exonuclease SbcCD ATPase subunit
VRLTIFLMPDHGPVTPVELNLADVFRTLTPPRPADPLSRDQLQTLSAAIVRSDKRLAGIKLDRSLEGLARIYANFGHADRFDGVVLRVQGEIAETAEGRATQVAAIQERDRAIRDLRGELERERAAGDRQRRVVEELTTRVTDLTGRVRQRDTQLRQAAREVEHLTHRLEQASHELQAAMRQLTGAQAAGDEARRQADVWRRDLSKARSDREAQDRRLRQLEATLEEREGVIAELTGQLRPPDPRTEMLD